MKIEDYLITENGEVINKITNHVLKPQPNNKGYLRVNLCGKKYFVHRLVAEKYIPNPYNKEQVNHIDGNKTNNKVNNLEWVTNQENRNHAVKTNLHLCGEQCSRSKLKQKDIDYIRKNNNIDAKILAQQFNVSISTIKDIINYRTWKNS